MLAVLISFQIFVLSAVQSFSKTEWFFYKKKPKMCFFMYRCYFFNRGVVTQKLIVIQIKQIVTCLQCSSLSRYLFYLLFKAFPKRSDFSTRKKPKMCFFTTHCNFFCAQLYFRRFCNSKHWMVCSKQLCHVLLFFLSVLRINEGNRNICQQHITGNMAGHKQTISAPLAPPQSEGRGGAAAPHAPHFRHPWEPGRTGA